MRRTQRRMVALFGHTTVCSGLGAAAATGKEAARLIVLLFAAPGCPLAEFERFHLKAAVRSLAAAGGRNLTNCQAQGIAAAQAGAT
jgi:hypothetical protein